MPRIEVADGRSTELPEGEPIGSVLPPEAIAARVDGELADLIADNTPVVGRDVFTQTAGIHADGDAKDELYVTRLSPAFS